MSWIGRTLGPAAALALLAAIAGLFLRAELQREVRLDSRRAAAASGRLPPAPHPRLPGGLDQRPLSAADAAAR